MRSRGRNAGSRPSSLVPARQCWCRMRDAAVIFSLSSMACSLSFALSDDDPGPRTQALQQPQHRLRRHRYAAGGRSEIFARQMQEHGAAAMRHPRAGVVIDLNDEVVEMMVPLQAITRAAARQRDRLIVIAVIRVFAPGVLRADGANGQKGPRPRMPIGAPPQLSGMED